MSTISPVGIPQRQTVDRGVEHGAILLFARAQRLLGHLAVGDVARERQDPILPADGHALAEHLLPAQAAVLALAVPFDAQLLPGNRAREQLHRVLLGIGVLAGTERAEIDVSELLATVAEGGAGFGIGIHDRAGFDVDDEDGILGGIEDRPVARLRHPQRLVGALALGDVVGDGERHGVEGAAQPTELIRPLQSAARSKISGRELFGRPHQSRGAPGEQEMKDQPHAPARAPSPIRPSRAIAAAPARALPPCTA